MLCRKSIRDLYPLLAKLESLVGKPQLINRSGFEQFRYPNRDILTLLLIKSARILSSLNAITVLIENGYIVEVGILIRTIKECIADISFLLEDYPEKWPSKDQQKYIDEFFSEEFSDPINPINTARKHNRVPSKKIHAGFARNAYKLSNHIKNSRLKELVLKITNPYYHQKATSVILNTYSGYVHYAYAQSMEIVGGAPPGFYLEGMAGTPKVDEWIENIISEIFSVYNHFMFICLKFNFNDEFEYLSFKQKEFAIKSGYDPKLE